VDEQSQKYLGRISLAASRMDRLITDALSYTKAMRQELSLEPVDTARLLRGMIESYPEFQPPNARVEIAGPLPWVVANEAGLTQCFSNLLGNAVKFVEKGRLPQVTIRAEPIDGRVKFWVEDNGIGIPREMHSKVFVMFQRLSKDFDGTGIGLALVRKVTERMGGRAGVESEAGKGSRFWIDLPAAN
jgi:signal transduction histidine kinase